MKFTPDCEKSFLTTTTSTPEKQVVCDVAITYKQQPHLPFELPTVSIHIFDPSGAKLRVHSPEVISSDFCRIFTPALVPWDRGKVRVSESLFFVPVKQGRFPSLEWGSPCYPKKEKNL